MDFPDNGSKSLVFRAARPSGAAGGRQPARASVPRVGFERRACRARKIRWKSGELWFSKEWFWKYPENPNSGALVFLALSERTALRLESERKLLLEVQNNRNTVQKRVVLGPARQNVAHRRCIRRPFLLLLLAACLGALQQSRALLRLYLRDQLPHICIRLESGRGVECCASG